MKETKTLKNPDSPKPKKKDSSPASGDDRNLVKVDEDFSEADFEDKFFLFWEKYSTLIVVGVVVFILIVVGFKAKGVMEANKKAAVIEAFQKANTDQDLVFFAKEYPDTPQAGLAYLMVAQNNFGEEKYGESVSFYRKATEKLEAPMIDRARIGEAVAQYQINKDEAIKLFEAIAGDATLLDPTRAEASYRLAVIHWENGNFKELSARLDEITALENPGQLWTAKVDQLRTTIPGLQKFEEDAAEGDASDSAGESETETGGEVEASAETTESEAAEK